MKHLGVCPLVNRTTDFVFCSRQRHGVLGDCLDDDLLVGEDTLPAEQRKACGAKRGVCSSKRRSGQLCSLPRRKSNVQIAVPMEPKNVVSRMVPRLNCTKATPQCSRMAARGLLHTYAGVAREQQARNSDRQPRC